MVIFFAFQKKKKRNAIINPLTSFFRNFFKYFLDFGSI